jgi:hypothetical protein
MLNILTAKRLTILLLACALTASCGSKPTHSDYFIVAFLPGTPAPSEEGVAALGNAVRQAGRDAPRFIAVDGAEPAGAAEPALEKQRGQAIVDAFARAGIDRSLIHVDLRPATEKGYAERKDSFTVQLGYGEMPQR